MAPKLVAATSPAVHELAPGKTQQVDENYTMIQAINFILHKILSV